MEKISQYYILYTIYRSYIIVIYQAYLCHESCEENGAIIESAAGWAGKCTIVRAPGNLLRTKITDNVTIENVRDCWDKITDISQAERLNSIQEATAALVSSLERLGNPEEAASNQFSYNSKDAIIYALGGKSIFSDCSEH